MRAFLVILLLGVFLPLSISAQRSDQIVERDGKQYYMHIVAQGQTLYGISKLYNVSAEEIEKLNPETNDGLSIGEALFVPVKSNMFPPPPVSEQPSLDPNGEYILHTVKQGETLYSISKLYRADMNDILGLNSGVELGLRIGEVLKIPQNDLDKPSTELVQPGPMDGWRKHRVKIGETLYGIAKMYQVEEASIREINDGLPEGLKAGESINIPIKEIGFDEVLSEEEYILEFADTVLIKNRYSVVVMLPLMLEEKATEEVPLSKKTIRLREISMSFYRGLLVALDSLKQRGARIDLTLMDVSSEATARAAAQKEVVQNAHLIVGPLQRKSIQVVAAVAKKRGIHMVCPVPQSNKILLSSPNISKVQASIDSEMKTLADHVLDHHAGENILLINSKNVSDARMIQVFKKRFQERLRAFPDSMRVQLKEIEGSTQFAGEIEKHLSPAISNVLIVPAGKESASMIANLQSKIQLLEEEYSIELYGSHHWMDFDFLDVSFKEETHLTIPSNSFIDEGAPRVQQFRLGYSERYETDATEYSFLGYDVMMFYGCGLIQHGIGFPKYFDSIDRSSTMAHGFDYRKTGMESGFENEFIHLLRQEEMTLIKAH